MLSKRQNSDREVGVKCHGSVIVVVPFNIYSILPFSPLNEVFCSTSSWIRESIYSYSSISNLQKNVESLVPLKNVFQGSLGLHKSSQP